MVTAPSNPEPGACYIVGAGATGEWAGHDEALACFTDGGWRFIAPVDSMQLVDKSSGETLAYEGGWVSGVVRAREVRVNGLAVLRERQPPIANPGGGATVDTESRTAISEILAALRSHGLIG